MNIDRILLDIESQADFFSPGGACYRPEHRQAAANIYRLFDWAQTEQVPVLSTLLRVRPGEIGPLASVAHCVEGTAGEAKLPRTVLPRSVDLGLRNSTDLPEDLFSRFQQVIVEKRDTDILAHARIERLISELDPTTWIICGAGLARGVLQAAVGLRSRGHAVVLAKDAVLELDDPLAEMAWRRIEAKDVVLAETADLVAPKPKRRRQARPIGQLLAMNNN